MYECSFIKKEEDEEQKKKHSIFTMYSVQRKKRAVPCFLYSPPNI